MPKASFKQVEDTLLMLLPLLLLQHTSDKKMPKRQAREVPLSTRPARVINICGVSFYESSFGKC